MPRHVSSVPSRARNGESSEEPEEEEKEEGEEEEDPRQNPVGALRSRIDRIHIVDRQATGGWILWCGARVVSSSTFLHPRPKVIFGTPA